MRNILYGTFIALGSFMMIAVLVSGSSESSNKKALAVNTSVKEQKEKLLAFASPKPTTSDPVRSIANQKVSPVSLKGDFYFSGEKVPLEDHEVRERLDRELHVNAYWHSNTIVIFKLANKYFPIIEPILEQYGVPDDFKYLAMAESGLRNVVSPAGAAGYWQFLSRTAQQYGLEVSDDVDERYDIYKSTVAACKYLKDAYAKFGSWTLAAASYNMGMNGLSNQVKKQRTTDYYDLYLNRETRRYVFRVLAFKEVYNNKQNFGFYFKESDKYEYPDHYVFQIDSSVSNWVAFAQTYGSSYKDLKTMNPWIKGYDLSNSSGNTYTVKLPKKN